MKFYMKCRFKFSRAKDKVTGSMMDDVVTKTRDESDERFTPRWGISICERLTGDSEVGKALHAVSHTVPYGKELEGETGRWTASK